MKYAVEIANTGSISKASEVLFVAQPNLSRAVKELETELGVSIFERSAKGMELTPAGESFVHYAQDILRKIDDLENSFRTEYKRKQRFSISVPRASYISEAFAKFTNEIDENPAEIVYMETNPQKAIHNILDRGYQMGVIRFAEAHEHFFTKQMKERGLSWQEVAEFKYVALFSEKSPLAEKEILMAADLEPFIEISHGDPYVPSVPVKEILKNDPMYNGDRVIYVFERGGQFDILMENPNTYMWVSPIPEKYLKNDGLIQKFCEDNQKVYKDFLIYKSNYEFSQMDLKFIQYLKEAKENCLGPRG